MIAWPESRWGAENSRLIDEALQPIAYAIVVALVAFILALSAKGSATRYSLLMSFSNLAYFGYFIWIANSPLAAMHALSLEIIFFILFPPAATALWVRARRLDQRSSASTQKSADSA